MNSDYKDCIYAFIDESGNEDLKGKVADTNSFYVLTAVVVNGIDYNSNFAIFEDTRKKYFQTGEMKSSSVGDNHKRRLKILADIINAEFGLYVSIIKKEYLFSPGFQYPKIFIKYLHRRLYHNLFDDYPFVSIIADRIKSPKFMEEFKRYIDGHFEIFPLFGDRKFCFENSKDDVFLQASDFISGSIRKYWGCPESLSDVKQLLKQKIRFIRPFPEIPPDYTYDYEINDSNNYDVIIMDRAIKEANNFIRLNSSQDDEDNQEMLHVLQYMLTQNYLYDSEKWIPTHELMKSYREAFGKEVSEQRLRNIIGKLRNKGVLIVSRSSGGYKLPSAESDMYEYLNRQNTQIGPMLHRIKITREIVLRATNGFDILEKKEYANLKKAIEVTEDWPVD
jgi:hypothetical protein